MSSKKFPWGEVVDYFTFDFDGDVFEVTKFHPWVRDGSRLIRGSAARDIICYHCEELHQSAGSLMALLIHWIAYKNIGPNNRSLAEGVCRALGVVSEK